MEKKDLRIDLLKKRENLRDVSDDFISFINNENILKSFKRIGIYYPLQGEINLLKLLDMDKKFCFPKTLNSFDIAFYEIDKNTKFEKGLFNVFEPVDGRLRAKEDIDAFLIPCVGITLDNKRIGYGKGYYDRYLKDYKGVKIGICYKELISQENVCDDNDLVLDLIIAR